MAFLLAGTVLTHAETLPDPTRPPANFIDLSASGGQGPTPTVAPTLQSSAGPQLQSVLLPRKGKPLAIISGQYVPLGERFAGMELISVSEQQVILLAGKKKHILKLTPAAEKTEPNNSVLNSHKPSKQAIKRQRKKTGVING